MAEVHYYFQKNILELVTLSHQTIAVLPTTSLILFPKEENLEQALIFISGKQMPCIQNGCRSLIKGILF